MLRKRKSVLVVLILFSLVFGPLGTANAQDIRPAKPRQDPQSVTGTITLWHDYAPPGGAEEAALNQVILNAQTANPGLTIEATYHTDLLADYNAALQSGSAPDMYLGSSDWVGDQARAGNILNIDSYLTGNLTNVTMAAINGNVVDGFLYGIPKQGILVALYYNKSALPTPPATTAELLSMLQNDGKSIAGVGDIGSYFYYGFWDAFGGQLMDGTGRCTADQGGYDLAMQYLRDLQTAGASLATDYASAETMFLNGNVDMLINGPWALANYEAVLGADLGVAILPSGPSGVAHVFTDSVGFYVNPNTANPADVVNLALYMTNQASSQIFTDVGGDIPVRTDVTSADPLNNTFAQIFAQGNPRPKVQQMFNYWDSFNKMVINVLTGIETPQVGVQRACNTMNVLNGFAPSTNTVTLWHPYGSGEETALLQVVDNAHAADSTLTIVPISVPLGTIYTDYETAVLSGGGPDMYIAPNDILGDQVRSGVVLNVDSYLQGNLTNVSQAAIDGMTINGQLYGVPESAKAVALYYNKSMISTPPTTTAELLSLLQSGETIASPGGGVYYLYGLWNAFGGQLMDVNGLCTAHQGGFTPAMQYLLDLQAAGANLEIDYATAQTDFVNGQVGMLVNGPWALADLKAALGSDLGVVLLPSGPVDIAKPINGIDGFYVNPNTTNLANTIDLALYMTSQASSQIFTDVGGHIPARSDVGSADPLINTFAQASAQSEPRSQSLEFGNYWVPFNDMFTDVLAGTVTPSDGVQRACNTMNVLNGFLPIVSSITRTFVSPSSLSSVNFTVTFSESVTGVDAGDFTLTTTGGVSGAAVSGVSGSGSVYTVTVNTGSGPGTIRLDVVDNNSIIDAALNPLGGTAVGDGNFIGGEIYTIKPFASASKWTSSFDLSHGWTVSQFVRTVGDVNNDGRDDLIGFGLDGVYVALSNGSSFDAVSKWSSSFDLSHGWTVSQFVRTVGDVNNDGRDDLIGFGLDGVYVALSNGTSFGPISKWSSSFDLSHGWTVSQFVRTVGDVNNDGRDDLIGFGLDGVYVALSNGTSFGSISKWSSSFDLSHGWTVSQFVRTVGDVNFDGRDDLIGFGLDGVYVALSNGTSFGSISKWSSSFDLSHGWTVAGFVRTVGDVNNDGRDDLIGFGQDGVYVALSNGASFDAVSRWTNDFDLSHGWTVSQYVRTVGDVNADGKADLVGFGLDGVYIGTAK